MNPDIVKERRNATFDVDTLTNILDGGAEKTTRRREIGECEKCIKPCNFKISQEQKKLRDLQSHTVCVRPLQLLNALLRVLFSQPLKLALGLTVLLADPLFKTGCWFVWFNYADWVRHMLTQRRSLLSGLTQQKVTTTVTSRADLSYCTVWVICWSVVRKVRAYL